MLEKTIRYYKFEAILPAIVFTLSAIAASLALYFRIRYNLVSLTVITVFGFVVFLIALGWFVFRLKPLVVAYLLQSKCYEKMFSDQKKKGLMFEEGGNRTGKSLDGFATLYYKSLALEQYVSRFTKLYSSKKTKEKLSQKDSLEYKEIKATYNFYRKHPELIPCLVTNVTIDDNCGRRSMELKGSHLLQLERLPTPAAVGLDESRSKIIGDIFKDKEGSYILTLLARFFNHNTGDNSLWVVMEQNSERAFHGYRDSVCMVKNQKGVKVLLEPRRLLKKLDKLFVKLDLMEQPSYGFAVKVLKLYSKTKQIGVLQLNFTMLGSESTGKEKLGDGIMQEYLPCDLLFNYDNRFFRTGYLCKNDDITLSRFKGRLQSESQVDDLIRLTEIDGKQTVTYRDSDAKQLWQQKKAKTEKPDTS